MSGTGPAPTVEPPRELVEEQPEELRSHRYRETEDVDANGNGNNGEPPIEPEPTVQDAVSQLLTALRARLRRD
jgi:hypothetical protein